MSGSDCTKPKADRYNSTMVTSTIPLVRPAKPLSSEALEGDLIGEGHPLFGLIWINRERMSGAPCFAGTRVPVKTLFEYLEKNYTLEEFLECFPSVTRQMVCRVLERSESALLAPA